MISRLRFQLRTGRQVFRSAFGGTPSLAWFDGKFFFNFTTFAIY